MKAPVEWTILLTMVGLFAGYFVSTSRRARLRLFLLICGLGIVVSVYGHVVGFLGGREDFIALLRAILRHRAGLGGLPTAAYRGFFGRLGVPLSIVIAASLCFAILALDKVFTKRQLKRWVYPALAWYFVIWIVLNVGLELLWHLFPYSAIENKDWLEISFSIDIPYFFVVRGGALVLLGAFAIAASRGFPIKLFQVLFPLALVLFAVSLIFDGWRRPQPWEQLFFLNVWWAFWLMA